MALKKEAGSRRKKVHFKVTAEPGSAVFVTGSFNNWDGCQYPMRDNPEHGVYKASVLLPPGRHEYKFIINGVWQADPNCPEWTPNDQGSLNSVITV